MSRSPAGEVDPVPRWTRIARQNLRRWPTGGRGVRVRVTFGFVFLALVARLTGPNPAPQLGPILFAIVLTHELPGALRARRATAGDADGGEPAARVRGLDDRRIRN